MMRARPGLLALAAVACGGGDTTEDGAGACANAIEVYEDADFDGYGDPDVTVSLCPDDDPIGTADNGDDCDDHNVSVHPGREEVCNEVDDDCDGTVDQGATGAPVWFEDADGDGFGSDVSTTSSCAWPVGYVTKAGDCDDADPRTNPATSEVCDGADNDCDGTADEPDELTYLTYYQDVDGDGYGDPKAPVEDCAQPPGSTWNDFDCDDAEPSTYPDAEEICGDLVDSNCDLRDCLDWIVDFEEGALGPEWALTSPNWMTQSGTVYEGTHAAANGDIGDSQRTSMSADVEWLEAGTVSFWHNESTESSYDYLRFYIDGAEQGSWSGTNSWRQETYSVSAGLHTLMWEYSKDGSVSSGADTVYVDLIEALGGTVIK